MGCPLGGQWIGVFFLKSLVYVNVLFIGDVLNGCSLDCCELRFKETFRCLFLLFLYDFITFIPLLAFHIELVLTLAWYYHFSCMERL